MKTTFLIFGITGDLSRRKLLPALRTMLASDECEPFSIIGVSRRDVDVPTLITESTGDDTLAPHTRVFTMDLAKPADYIRLAEDVKLPNDEQLLIYLSVPPSAAADIVDFLGQAGLNTPNVKIMFEKPFGFDTSTAKEFIERTSMYYSEEQIYRIDHYMAKEIAADLLRVRRNAENHHHYWSNASVATIRVVASESIGIEGRAQFYEQTGALRDFIQGHLLQLLALMLITAPGSSDLPIERLAALKQLRPADPYKAIRGQYIGYQDEAENPGSTVETFASVQLESTDPKWVGVELLLVTGKALHEKRSYIEVEYTDGSTDVFEEGRLPNPQSKGLDAYERVLLEAMAGNKDIFTTSPEVIRDWEIVAPLQQAWSMNTGDLVYYPVGSSWQDVK